MKKQGFLYSSAVLMVSALTVKIFGALFRIPLANMLGGTGMGYFSSAYSIFMPVYAVSVTGLPAAVSGVSSAALTSGRGDGEAIKRTALRLFGAVGICACAFIFLFAYPFCRYISEDMNALPAVMAIAPSVAAGCLASVYRGYYEGMRNMYPTALSQTVEVAAKLVFGLLLCGMTIFASRSYPLGFLRITGYPMETLHSEQDIINASYASSLPWAAAAAVFGITISTFAGLAFIVLWDKREKSKAAYDKGCMSEREIRSELLKIAFPAAVGALVINLTSTIDLITIIKSLRRITEAYPDYFAALGMEASEVPNFIYGSFAGLAVTVFNLVPSVTNMFGKSILPAAAAAKAKGDKKLLGDCSRTALFASGFVSVPAGLGIAFLAPKLLSALFTSRTAEISVCSDAMSILGYAVPPVCISSAAFAVLQAAGRADIPVKLMAVGAAVKLAGNLLLTSVPRLNVSGAAISTLLCYGVILAMSLDALKKYACLNINEMIPEGVSVIAEGLLCAATAYFVSEWAEKLLPSLGCAAVSCAAGGCVYLAAAWIFGTIDKEKIRKLCL